MKDLIEKVIKFRDDRDWKQFHDPKSLIGSVLIEASELLEIFQWSNTKDSYKVATEKKEKIEEEFADVMIYLLTLAHDIDIDIEKAVNKKIDTNNKKYPVIKSKGKSTKYDNL